MERQIKFLDRRTNQLRRDELLQDEREEDYNAIPELATLCPSPYVEYFEPLIELDLKLDASANAGFANYQTSTLETPTDAHAHGLSFQGNYTWAHNISDAQGDAQAALLRKSLVHALLRSVRPARGSQRWQR